MTKFIKISNQKIVKLLKRYKAAKGGVAAIEFVFVAPIMIGMYFGLAEISTAISQDRQISHSANVAGDLTTQVATVNANQMSEIMTAAIKIMGVPTSKLGSIQMEIASFTRDASDNLVELGTATLNGPYPENYDATGLNDLILSEASGVVVARVSYEYQPLGLAFQNFRSFNGNFTMSETFLLKPRTSANVNFLNAAGDPTDFTCSLSTAQITASCS